MTLRMILVAGAALLVTAVQAADKQLTADEIEDLLSANTAMGEWQGRPTRQYFSPSGLTEYVASGTPMTRGTWRADRNRQAYCSVWPDSGEACYTVWRVGTVYEWRNSKINYRSQFVMRKGRSLSFVD